MLRKYIERRERALHSLNDNRRSLPFEWGLEHIGIDDPANPESALRKYAEDAVAHSDAFFAHPSTKEYDFDGHLLRFPSAIETPYPANNVVWGRFFEGGKDAAVLVLPHWNCKWDAMTGLCRALQ